MTIERISVTSEANHCPIPQVTKYFSIILRFYFGGATQLLIESITRDYSSVTLPSDSKTIHKQALLFKVSYFSYSVGVN